MPFRNALPDRFSSLEPFVAYWAVEDKATRSARRDAATYRQCALFHAQARDLLPLALAYLEKAGTRQGVREKRLMQLILAHAHAAQVVHIGKNETSHIVRLRGRWLPIAATANSSTMALVG